MSVGRHACRVAVVKAIFAEEFRRQPQEELIEMVLEKMKPVDKDQEYIKEALDGVLKNIDGLKELIARYAPERPVSEINPVNRAILLLGAYEVKYVDNAKVPVAVAINEAIEVARELSDESGIAFVNGVLNKIAEES